MGKDLSEIAQHVQYDPQSGDFVRLLPSTRSHTGTRLGTLQTSGYLRISVLGNRYLAHRLAWYLAHGEWPSSPIDHINGNRTDNRLENLRLASVCENNRNNLGRQNSTGYKGVRRSRGGRFTAVITMNGRPKHLGTFGEAAEAAQAYDRAALELFGPFARPNFITDIGRQALSEGEQK